MNPIRVFVVDHHPMFRRGIQALVAGEQHFNWAGEAGDGDDVVAAVLAAQPDVVLVDLIMPGSDGVSVIERLRPRLPLARFVILAGSCDAADVRRAMAAGAAGFVLKSASKQEMVTVIHTAHAGRRVLSPEVTAMLSTRHAQAPIGADLTERERSLLSLMARGLPNQEISSRLSIAMPTVKFHVTNILSKLHVENRTAAVMTALRHKIVCLE
ncbi:MAG: response regulator transcription factor [Burkholderiales bacterium]|nr:response regulator transcription factor [Burkholderiales bacterium]MDE1929183.1 response regulator transcription factor [Burkholderiales bacterium]MDE2505497.1 response regulator transcription factor [Burkholderiales bacterium]